ncbi:MAG: c-type cytochrome [Vicinamibacterales bacterium]
MIRSVLRVLAGLALLRMALKPRRPHLSDADTGPRSSSRSPDAISIAWRRGLRTGIVVFACGLATIGGIVAVSGVIPLKASSGHWAITQWLLEFGKRRSVVTHTIGVEAPDDLDDPAMVMRGAAHYELGCRPCHGSPDLPRPPVVEQMTPVPPYLPEVLGRWDPEEVFYIVKHGLKFTGMPAWPATARDDEVWAMTAFLEALPAMNADQYRRLARGGAQAGVGETLLDDLARPVAPLSIVEICSRCHGADGRGRLPGAFPTIAGQRPDYLYKSLQAFVDGRRSSGIMATVVTGLPSASLRDAADFYGGLPGLGSAAVISPGRLPGGEIAAHGIPARDVPACSKCHGPGSHERNPTYPNLAGQDAAYIVQQLELLKAGVRGGTEFEHVMRKVAANLTAQDIRDVAQYYSSID